MNTRTWDYWRATLAGQAQPIHEDQPQIGYYRTKGGKGRQPEPVAIYEHDGALVALRGATAVDPFDVWTWVCTNPISYETYQAVAQRGEPWPGMDQTVAAQIGDNNPPTDEAELLREQIEAASKGVTEYAKIADDETAAKAQSLRSRLLELKGQAEKAHKAEKEPHLSAGRAVDKKWLPVAKQAEDAAGRIRAALSGYETEKLRIERERQQREAEEARKLAEAGKPIAPPEPTTPPAASPIRGAYGRAASVRVVKVATVVDQDKLYLALRDNPDLVSLLQKLAQRVVDNTGVTPPGVEVTEQRKVA
jgi:hypothetical protein